MAEENIVAETEEIRDEEPTLAPDTQENSGINTKPTAPGTIETGDTPEKLLFEKFKDIIETMPKGEEGSIYDGPSLEELYSQKDKETYIAEHGSDEGWVDPFGPVFKVEIDENNGGNEMVIDPDPDKENVTYEVTDGEVEGQISMEEVVAEDPVEDIIEPSQPVEVYNANGERIS